MSGAARYDSGDMIRSYLRGADIAAALRQPESAERLLDAAKREARRSWRAARALLAVRQAVTS